MLRFGELLIMQLNIIMFASSTFSHKLATLNKLAVI